MREEDKWSITWGFPMHLYLGIHLQPARKSGKGGQTDCKRMKKTEAKHLFRDSWKLFVAVAGTRRPHMCCFKMYTLQMRKHLCSSWANYKWTGPKPHQYHQGRAVQSCSGCWRNNCSTRLGSSHWSNCRLSLNTQLCGFLYFLFKHKINCVHAF